MTSPAPGTPALGSSTLTVLPVSEPPRRKRSARTLRMALGGLALVLLAVGLLWHLHSKGSDPAPSSKTMAHPGGSPPGAAITDPTALLAASAAAVQRVATVHAQIVVGGVGTGSETRTIDAGIGQGREVVQASTGGVAEMRLTGG